MSNTKYRQHIYYFTQKFEIICVVKEVKKITTVGDVEHCNFSIAMPILCVPAAHNHKTVRVSGNLFH